MDVLANRAEAMNIVHQYANQVTERMIKALSEGFRLTNDWQLYQKDKDRINYILRTANASTVPNHRSHIRSDDYNVSLELSQRYQVDEHSCSYYDITVYLWNNKDKVAIKPHHRELVSAGYLTGAKKEMEDIKKEISELESRLHPLRLLLGR